jgi:aspartyl-tRNA(Asn)/glutamyl-tRNA(Gln) amidotransferase subunit B
MEKGHLRCDANVSLRIRGQSILNTKTEIKNVNSIEAVRTAIGKEIIRQTHEYDEGRKIQAWTLEWDEDSQSLKKMRSKETEADYRYFREPDLLPVFMSSNWKESILLDFPELPLARKTRFISEFGLPEYDADILTIDRSMSDYFISTANAYKGDVKRVSNWLINDVMRMLKESGITARDLVLTPAYLAKIINLVDNNVINTNTAKELLSKVNSSVKSPEEIIEMEGLGKVSDDQTIRSIAELVVAEFPKEVNAFKSGKNGLMGFFVGQVMKRMDGKADAQITRNLLEELLK